MSNRTRRKLSKAAQRRYLAKQSEIIIDGYINILEGFKYSVKIAEEIHNIHASSNEDLKPVLIGLSNRLKLFLKVQHSDPSKLTELIDLIQQKILNHGNRFKNSLALLKAISELRKQFECFVKHRTDVEVINEVKKLLNTFFSGCEVLSDTDYLNFKEKVISVNAAASVFF